MAVIIAAIGIASSKFLNDGTIGLVLLGISLMLIISRTDATNCDDSDYL